MNIWKNKLKQAFDAPEPVKKRAFLRHLDLPGMSVHAFLFSQIGYIRKWVWCVSAMVFAVSMLGAAFLPDTVLWLISGLTPLMALTIISESGRSELYKMDELEMATRFSLKSVVFARLVILGLMNLLILVGVLPAGIRSHTSAPFAAGLYIVTPFLLTSFTGLCIVRKFRGQETIYACVGATVGISVFFVLSHNIVPFIYEEQCIAAWMITALALLFGNGKQCIAMIKKTEEFAWNLS